MEKKSIYIQDVVLESFEQDGFGHKYIAQAIIDSLQDTKPPFVIGIFGGWGTGKSSLLKLIESKLSPKSFVSVNIDAWMYSSADNLRRAFLVRVADRLAPNLLEDLSNDIFSSTQKVQPGDSSLAHKSNKNFFYRCCDNFLQLLPSIPSFVLLFVTISLCLIVVLVLVELGSYLLQELKTQTFFEYLSIPNLIDSYKTLLLIPLLLSLVSKISLNINTRQYTIQHERIDADELFARCFQKVIDKATKNSKRKVVVIIDNLDRLSDNKIIEALESLKTYLNSEKCLFIVACDDNVVRDVIDASRDRDLSSGTGTDQNNKAGEHYLDKFFQQTFRLPEYMGIDLHDFAYKNFKTTKICVELERRSIDIHNLISIILPSDANSPRKVKRLLNEFISLYEIVSKRENKKDGKLKPGSLSTNIEFLGKFSTIRSEYPHFFKLLISDSSILEKIDSQIKKPETSAEALGTALQLNLNQSLVNYLLKTVNISVNDLNPYIWLSQDQFSLGLSQLDHQQLIEFMSNGNTEGLRDLLRKSEDKDYREKLGQVANRLVGEQLKGINQVNGITVLTQLLPEFESGIRQEIANVCVRFIHQRSIDTLANKELFSLLRWANNASIQAQKNVILETIFSRLENVSESKKVFTEILDNSDILQKYQSQKRITSWLDILFSPEKQNMKIASSITEGETNLDENEENRDISKYIIMEIVKNPENLLIKELQNTKVFIEYLFNLLAGNFSGVPKISIGENEIGNNIQIVFDTAISSIRNNTIDPQPFWNGFCEILLKSKYPEDLLLFLGKIEQIWFSIPTELIDSFIIDMFTHIDNSTEEHIEEELVKVTLDTVIRLRSQKGVPFEISELKEIRPVFSKLVGRTTSLDKVLEFVGDFVNTFNSQDGEIFLSGLINGFVDYANTSDQETKMLDKLLAIDKFLNVENRKLIVSKISQLYVNSDLESLEKSQTYLEKVIPFSTFRNLLVEISNSWISALKIDDSQILDRKMKILISMIKNKIQNPEQFCEKITNLLDNEINQDQIRVLIENFSEIKKKISQKSKYILAKSILDNISKFGDFKILGLSLISNFIPANQKELIEKYSSEVLGCFDLHPIEILQILKEIYEFFSEDQRYATLSTIFSKDDLEQSSRILRESVSQLIFSSISSEKKLYYFQNILGSLDENGDSYYSFLRSSSNSLSIQDLVDIRNEACAIIREKNASIESENKLRFLAATGSEALANNRSVFELFCYLFDGGRSNIEMAIRHVRPCFEKFGLSNSQKGRIAKSLGEAASREHDEEISREIVEIAQNLHLSHFNLTYWENKLKASSEVKRQGRNAKK